MHFITEIADNVNANDRDDETNSCVVSQSVDNYSCSSKDSSSSFCHSHADHSLLQKRIGKKLSLSSQVVGEWECFSLWDSIRGVEEMSWWVSACAEGSQFRNPEST